MSDNDWNFIFGLVIMAGILLALSYGIQTLIGLAVKAASQ